MPTSTTVSASINTFSSDSLSVVQDGSILLTANLQTKSSPLFQNRAASVTFQNVDQLTVSQGDASNFLNGNSLTFWNGNDQSIGFGGLLWANMGFTSNIFGGEIINLTNTMATVQAPPSGDYEVNVNKEISAVNSVKLNTNPANASMVAAAQTLTKIVNGVLLLTTAVAGGYSINEIVRTDKASIDADTLKARMTQANEDLEIMTMLVVGVQAASVLLGAALQIMSQFAADTAFSNLSLNGSGALLEAGVTPLASTLVMTPTLVGLMAADPAGSVSISAGVAPKPEIQLSAPGRISIAADPLNYINLDGASDMITLVAGATSIELGPNGITMNGLQILGNTPMGQFGPDPMPPAPLPPTFDLLSGVAPGRATTMRDL
jgi:hypothetical protein